MGAASAASSLAWFLGVAGLLVACGGRENRAPEADADAGNTPRVCDTDFTRFENTPRASFRDDVMPVFGLMCTLSSCHSGETPAAHLYLGVRCQYDPNARLSCKFPDASDPDNTFQPLTQTVLDSVRAALLSASVTAPAVARVVPGKPGASFLVDKIAGTQGDRGYDCTAPPSAGTSSDPCGMSMPFGSDPLCITGDAARFDAVVTWIAQGARDD